MTTTVIFDLDGTLIDSDAALVAPFVALGLSEDEITFGHPIEEFCATLGISVERYVELYDVGVVQPYAGVEAMLDELGAWSVCSNKHPASGHAELERLGWTPQVALFSDSFGGGPKRLAPVIERLEVQRSDVLFVGDTAHDRQCAEDAGVAFAWAGWNPRTQAGSPQGTVLSVPGDLLGLIG